MVNEYFRIMSFNDIIGQDIAKEIIQKDIIKGRVASSYLFVGPSGVGKKLTAINLTKTLNCLKKMSEPCDDCVICKLIDKGHFPDLILIYPNEKGNINIDRIRELKQILSLRTTAKRVVIIDDAETMNDEAQNAFLKTLEEPPPDTTIILISSNLNYLFSTIISRCKIVKFRRLNISELEILLKKHGIKNHKLLANLSGGSMGKAVRLSESPVRKEAIKFAHFPVRKRLSVVRNLKDLSIEEFLDSLYVLYGDVLAQHFGLKVRNTDIDLSDKELPLSLKGMDVIREAMLALKYNVNSENVLYRLSYKLPELI